MTTDIALSNTASQMMSTREIAELTGKRHDHVIRDVRSMIAELNEDAPNLGDQFRELKDGRNYTSCFLLGRQLTETLITGYSIPLRHKVVKRLHELEQQAPTIPRTLPEALRLAADLAEQNNGLRLVVQQQAPQVAALSRIATSRGTMCLTDAAKHLGVRRKELLHWLSDNRWIYRREGCAHWLGFQPRLDAGWLEHKVTVLGVEEDGLQRLASQVRVTPKGLTVLAQKIGSEF